MIDFHSHFLPGIDDGSDSISVSMAMLDAWRSQDITTVVATPHFYAERNNPERFLRRRDEAFGLVQEVIDKMSISSFPDIKLGAEVRFFDGISRFDGLNELCLEGTDLLLLEVGLIASSTGIMPVAAHIERYFDQPRHLVNAFLDLNIFFQSNAEFFLEPSTSRKAMKMLKKGIITFLGSDAHNMDRRPVNIGPALSLIKKSLGERFVSELSNRQCDIIDQFNSEYF